MGHSEPSATPMLNLLTGLVDLLAQAQHKKTTQEAWPAATRGAFF